MSHQRRTYAASPRRRDIPEGKSASYQMNHLLQCVMSFLSLCMTIDDMFRIVCLTSPDKLIQRLDLGFAHDSHSRKSEPATLSPG
jgi:hypothetical protein